jgi:hypothetical protein
VRGEIRSLYAAEIEATRLALLQAEPPRPSASGAPPAMPSKDEEVR